MSDGPAPAISAAPDFRGWLARNGLGQTDFCRVVERLSGRTLPLRTVQAWARDSGRMSAADWALLVLLERHPSEWRYGP